MRYFVHKQARATKNIQNTSVEWFSPIDMQRDSHTCCRRCCPCLPLLVVSVHVKVTRLTLRRHTLQALDQTRHLRLARRLRYPLHWNYK